MVESAFSTVTSLPMPSTMSRRHRPVAVTAIKMPLTRSSPSLQAIVLVVNASSTLHRQWSHFKAAGGSHTVRQNAEGVHKGGS
jgi:hypothetical protein